MGRTREDCAQLGLEARSRGRLSSNVNGTTVCVSHVSGITGARHVIEGNIEYGYSWLICGWTSNNGLTLTATCWAIAVEAKMSIDPAARANCKDFSIAFLRTTGGREGWFRYRKVQQPNSTESLEMKTGQQCHRDKDKCCCRQGKIG
jgi:hypothetical protein